MTMSAIEKRNNAKISPEKHKMATLNSKPERYTTLLSLQIVNPQHD
jgi:hypothetical protein